MALVLGMGMVLGSWIGKRVIEELPRERFQRYVAVLLVFLAGYMFVHG